MMKSKTILILSKELPPQVGGAGVVALNLYRYLLDNGRKVTISRFYNYEKLNAFWGMVSTFKHLLISCLYDVVILNDLYFKKVWLVLFRGYFSKRCVIYLHGSEPEFLIHNSKYRDRFLLLCVNSYKVVAVSSYMKAKFLSSIQDDKIKNVLRSKVVVIRNNVNSEVFSYDYNQQDSKVIKIVSASRIIKEKGYFKVADIIFKLYFEKNKTVEWHIAGEGKDEKEIRDYCETLGIRDLVTFHGALEQQKLARLYNKCNFFLMLSELQESLGLVYMEASCCGCYSIGFNRFGVKEAILEGKTGSLVDSVEQVMSIIENGKIEPLIISNFATHEYANNTMYKRIESLF